MKNLFAAGLFAVAAVTLQSSRTFIGTITDGMCDRADHSRMRMGPTDAECAIACAEEHDATFVLYDGTDVYALSDQDSARKFVGRRVKVSGALDAKMKTITVSSITPAK